MYQRPAVKNDNFKRSLKTHLYIQSYFNAII